MKQRLLRLRDELGPLGLGSAALLLAAFLFFSFALQPLQEQSVELQGQLARQKSSGQPAAAANRVGELYRFLGKPEQTTDWLAKLHGIGQATGVQLRSASYKSHAAGGRLERYEILLPVSGSYAQLREFLKRSLAEIPVMSVDQMSLKRENRNDGAVQAELRLTLHQVKR